MNWILMVTTAPEPKQKVLVHDAVAQRHYVAFRVQRDDAWWWYEEKSYHSGNCYAHLHHYNDIDMWCEIPDIADENWKPW